jgi:chromosome segregation ATPase
MDDRNKRIEDLIKNNQENHVSLNKLLEDFGENLYSRSKDMQAEFEDIIQYSIYLQEISESNTAIGKVEEKNRRFLELGESIEKKEQEEKERSKEMAVCFRRLGKALLENNDYEDFTSLFKEQSDALKAKLESLESRIKEIENKEGSNVFSWIGKSAQGLVLKSFLSKAQESQEQLYQNVGERYDNRASVSDDEVAEIRTEIDRLNSISRSAMNELSILKDEKRVIQAGFDIDGNPQKQIQNVKNRIARIRDELAGLYRNFGAQASGIMDAELKPERKYFIDTIVTAEDGEIIGRAVRLNQTVTENEKAIGKLRASLSIDEENDKILKFKKTIEEKKVKITDLEKNIADMEDSVRSCEDYIKELQKQL